MRSEGACIMSFDARFIHPFSMCLAGPSQSGKTTFIYSLLASAPRLINAPIDYVVCFLGSNDKTLKELVEFFGTRIQFVHGLPKSFEQYIDPTKNGFFVIDDLMTEGTRDDRVSQLYTKHCHHSNVSVALILQNAFHKGRERGTILRNCHYLVIFNTPLDQTIARSFADRAHPSSKGIVMRIFSYVLARYRYLLLDGKQETPLQARYRTDIFHPEFQRCFVVGNYEGERLAEAGLPPAFSQFQNQEKA